MTLLNHRKTTEYDWNVHTHINTWQNVKNLISLFCCLSMALILCLNDAIEQYFLS